MSLPADEGLIRVLSAKPSRAIALMRAISEFRAQRGFHPDVEDLASGWLGYQAGIIARGEGREKE